ncbi:class I SAM-dependent methyltransferase [Streptoalloteichus hindustanus]|uniref:Methyltransferase domain-containing protein n=1 Tax=Streptoalloteichus hindustanus TaxID=2017 RepID=A0A1M5AVM7_STRHI|nr:class I SAM-dependent methyltransferase [Streptoalloteichus hindustanus]SHF34265.1 Methyltransferase domain-containing protein [Streptoalloteichus hindustanus]
MRTDAVQRVLEAELVAARERRDGADPLVLDVGGGSGVWAVPLAAAGCLVTVIDSSPNALATLRRRAQEAGVAERVTAVQGDADALADVVPDAGVDLVLGHGVLEVVDDAETAIAALAAAARPGGAVSVLVANRYAAVLGRALAGRLGDARRLLDDPHGRVGAHDPVLRRFDSAGLSELVAGAGLAVEVLQGHGVVSDLVPGAVLEAQGAAEALADLELAAAHRSPLRDVATRLHALGRRASA